ncbi:MAG: GntR family transcriptional regulator [Solobacterium sp.]|nr:GntR family transcriptional regulator [Solobacterium sp.]
MNIFIDNRSGVPIYTQIHAQIRDQIISGALQPEEPLPSIRTLARDLRISVITTKRAYDELEKEGLIYTVAGKGCFVAEKNLDLVREENLRRIEEDMDEIRALAGSCGLTKEEILEMWNTIWED